MRKFLAIFLVLFSAIVLIGCTEKGSYVTGEYTHKIKETSVVLTVDKNGFITSVNIEVDGEATTNKDLEQAKLEQAVIDNQGIFGIKEDLDGVTGPAISVNAHRYHEVLTEVLKKASK